MNKTSIATSSLNDRVYCLYRVSTDQQVNHDENNTADIPMQRKECHKFAERMGWNIVGEEQEEGVSGHKVRAADRDKLQLIKKAAREGTFDILLVFMFDRIGRISDETPFVVEWFVKNGIRVWSTKEGEQRFESHTDKLTNYIRFWQADGESEKTSIRTSTRMGQIVEEGHFTGGSVAYGYNAEKLGRTNRRNNDVCDLVINEDEAVVVRLIFDKYVNEGKGAQSIANFLNSHGYKNRSGRNWHPASISGIIRNITYTGVLRSGQSRSQVLPELQIIDEHTFSSAGQIRAQRSKTYEETRTLPMNVSGKALLAGNVFCGHCGLRLAISTSGKGRPNKDGIDPKRVRYVCQTKTRKKGECDGQTGYTLSVLDGMIEEIVRNIFVKVRGFSKAELITSCHDLKLNEQRTLVRNTQQRLEQAQKSLNGLKEEIMKAVIGESSFPTGLLSSLVNEAKTKCEELESEFKTAKDNLEYSQAVLESTILQYNQVIDWSEIFDTSNAETRKMIVSQLVERVDVHQDYKLHIKFRISIEQFLVGLDIPA